MTSDKYEIPDEIFEAVKKARRALDEVIPYAAAGSIGLTFTRIDEVMEEMVNIAKTIHASKDTAPQEFFTAHYATEDLLDVIRDGEFLERFIKRTPAVTNDSN